MFQKNKTALFYLISFTLTLVPILNVIKIINYGDNNLSNDYLLIIPTIVKALDGHLSIGEFINASWLRSHFIPVPMLMYIINAYFFHWNTFLDMYFGVILMFLRLILIWDMFTRWQNGVSRLLALPFLSFIIFSATQISTYTWGGVSTTFGLLMFLGTLGIWALIFFDGKPLGFWIMVVCGILCSWTWGAGVLIWPLYLLVIISLRYHKTYNIILWFGGAIFAAIPYVYFMLRIALEDSTADSGLNLFNLKTVVLLLGASLTEVKFQKETTLFWNIGFLGLFSFIGLVFTWHRVYNRTFLKYFIPSLVVILWGILGAWQISMGRTDLAPWYTSVSINFWLGLFGFAYLLAFQVVDKIKKDGLSLKYIEQAFPVLFLSTMLVVYLQYNVFTKSQPFYLPSRAPSSAACLRNYRSAPTYCEGLLYQWGIGYVEKIEEMAIPLERHQLSSFSPSQTWTLQGDFVFKDIKIQNPLFLDVSWWGGLNGERLKWNDYRHLDLMLPSSSAIVWPIDLTNNIDNAVLQTAMGVHTLYADIKDDEPVTFIITTHIGMGEEKEVYRENYLPGMNGWKKIQVDLREYLGKKVTLRFSAIGAEGGAGMGAMFRHPVISIYQNYSSQEVIYQPENVEFLEHSQNDINNNFVLDGSDARIWSTVNMSHDADSQDTWIPSSGAMFQLVTPINLCLANYSDILVDIGQSENIERRYVSVQLWNNTGYQVFEIPLIYDEQRHVYSYPLKLLDLESYSFLHDIRVLPTGAEDGQIQFGGVTLVSVINDSDNCANYYPAKLIIHDSIVGEITTENQIGQTFVSECRGAIDSIGVFTATFARDNTEPLLFTVIDKSSGKEVWKQSISGENVENNGWESISLDPIANSYQKEYYISLESPTSTFGNAVTAYQSQASQYDLGQLYINGMPSETGDLVFRYHCSEQ